MVENRADQPLLDINIELEAGPLMFSDSLSRLEAREKRQVRHGDLSGRDGTPFNLWIERPKQIVIAARIYPETTSK